MIQEPVILHADDGAMVFRTKKDAESYTEPIDIENGVYRAAFDATGRLLRCEPHANLSRGVLSEIEPAEFRREEVAAMLRTMLLDIAAVRRVLFNPAALSDYSLEELVEISKAYANM